MRDKILPSKPEEFPPERRKENLVLFEKFQNVEQLLLAEKNQWSFLGFTVKDLIRNVIWLIIASWWGSGFYNKIDASIALTQHLAVCNDNRDKWATAKYGHPFDCGKPTDGWQANFGKLPN